MLWLYRRVIFGKLDKADLLNILDLSPREIAIFVPLILLVLWMGIYPSSFIDFMAPAVDGMVGRLSRSRPGDAAHRRAPRSR